MINKLGIFTLLTILALPFLALDYFFGSKFVDDFLRNQSLQIMGTILALNIATAAFLVGHLMDIEAKAQKNIFSNSTREIKHNIYFMLIIFFVQMLVLTLRDSSVVITFSSGKYWFMGCGLVLFFAYLLCLYEITAAIFSVRSIMNKK